MSGAARRRHAARAAAAGRQPSGGFTLLELMVVIAVVGVILVLAAPSMREMVEMRRLRAVTAQVVTDLQFARSEAVARRAMVRVWFRQDAQRTCYTIYTAPNSTLAQRCNCLLGEGTACAAGSKEIKTVVLLRSQGVTVAEVLEVSDQTAFAFDPAHGGLVTIPTDLNLLPLPNYAIDTALDNQRRLRVGLTQNGRPTVCAPVGSTIAEIAC